ncbi:serine hydrolase domain-containing protein [Streptomyces sp. ISL-86]|uniref:serine hydrolase domain-containing protein n=1 Tax=Streptomyces sp. ISL-86 TaxID=2819187 RepID=UPI001BE9CA1D|nr:serine hydrolase domain-containing protein [Streptomyces sp. ISL-86]MBT2455300.1 beta-lactamase family protein [Streptomyces sp. ISL-86]
MPNSTARSPRWISLVAAGAAVVSVAVATLPASAAERGAAPVSGTVSGHHHPLDEEALRALMAPGAESSGTMVRVTGPGVRFREATGPLSQDPAASFRIGSITKLFTSTVVLQLVTEGHFTLDTPVREVLPDTFPENWQPITIGQLLGHTSGLGLPCKKPAALTPAAMVAALTDAACKAPEYPVTTQRYNGMNYYVAGLVVEKVTGRSFGDEVQRRIARPLGLRHTYLPKPGDPAMPTPSLTAPVDIEPWAWAEGGMISNAPDLERFLGALLRGRLLPPAQQKHLFELPALAGTGEDVFSVAGLVRGELKDGTPAWGKTGSMDPGASGVFGTADGSRVLVYSYTPLTRDRTWQRAHAYDLVKAAL